MGSPITPMPMKPIGSEMTSLLMMLFFDEDLMWAGHISLLEFFTESLVDQSSGDSLV